MLYSGHQMSLTIFIDTSNLRTIQNNLFYKPVLLIFFMEHKKKIFWKSLSMVLSIDWMSMGFKTNFHCMDKKHFFGLELLITNYHTSKVLLNRQFSSFQLILLMDQAHSKSVVSISQFSTKGQKESIWLSKGKYLKLVDASTPPMK